MASVNADDAADTGGEALQPVVHVIDDDSGVRESLRELFESAGFRVRGYSRAADCMADWNPRRWGCMILDLRVPDMSGLELQKQLRGHRMMPIIFLTAHGSVSAAVRAMRGGACDFLTKPFDPEELLEVVRAAIHADAKELESYLQLERYRQQAAQLTTREAEVFRLTAKGFTVKEVARVLTIAPKTVELHRCRVMKKMDVHSAAALARIHAELEHAQAESENLNSQGGSTAC